MTLKYENAIKDRYIYIYIYIYIYMTCGFGMDSDILNFAQTVYFCVLSLLLQIRANISLNNIEIQSMLVWLLTFYRRSADLFI